MRASERRFARALAALTRTRGLGSANEVPVARLTPHRSAGRATAPRTRPRTPRERRGSQRPHPQLPRARRYAQRGSPRHPSSAVLARRARLAWQATRRARAQSSGEDGVWLATASGSLAEMGEYLVEFGVWERQSFEETDGFPSGYQRSGWAAERAAGMDGPSATMPNSGASTACSSSDDNWKSALCVSSNSVRSLACTSM